jgi:hypothetical protein
MFSDRLHLIKDDNKTVEPEMNSPQDKYKLWSTPQLITNYGTVPIIKKWIMDVKPLK